MFEPLAIIGNLSDPFTLLLIASGACFGIVMGAVPGLSGTLAIALLLPFTFGLEPATALLILGAVYCGSEYGGAIPAILINTPGTAAALCTTFDGYPMARKGEAQKALDTALISSSFGSWGLFDKQFPCGCSGHGFLRHPRLLPAQIQVRRCPHGPGPGFGRDNGGRFQACPPSCGQRRKPVDVLFLSSVNSCFYFVDRSVPALFFMERMARYKKRKSELMMTERNINLLCSLILLVFSIIMLRQLDGLTPEGRLFPQYILCALIKILAATCYLFLGLSYSSNCSL